ncbi:MAG: sigma-54 interaction domain-containing protein [Bacillota bacterium]|jgi:PAS domain S-box-containing protein
MNKQQKDLLQTNIILNSVADGVFTVDGEWRITFFNRAAEKITGIKQEDALGNMCRDIFHSSICDGACTLRQCIEKDCSITNKSIFIITPDGSKVPVSISASPLKDDTGRIIGGVEVFRDLSEVNELRKQLTKSYTFQDIIGKSKSMQHIFGILPNIAKSNSTVLLLGESGTGKELVARAVHNLSGRRNRPLVAVNCGALPDTLLESELFGYKAGAFTDAKRDKPGYFARAEKGTIFLDEIGDISPALQVKLLRVLQEKTYEPLGATSSVKADVRVIAATNKDLEAMVREEKFRNDLYYRLNVIQLKLPPLRERKEDIPLLADHIIQRFNNLKGKNILGLSRDALALLMKYDYPGNVRELENIIEYAFILCEEGLILADHLPEKFSQRFSESNPKCTAANFTLDEVKKQAVLDALERNSWKRMATCRELGISKGTLRRMIQQYQLREPE